MLTYIVELTKYLMLSEHGDTKMRELADALAWGANIHFSNDLLGDNAGRC